MGFLGTTGFAVGRGLTTGLLDSIFLPIPMCAGAGLDAERFVFLASNGIKATFFVGNFGNGLSSGTGVSLLIVFASNDLGLGSGPGSGARFGGVGSVSFARLGRNSCGYFSLIFSLTEVGFVDTS